MRRYHRFHSLPFLIAGIEPVGSSLSGLNGSGATSVAKTPQKPSGEAKTCPIGFLISLFLGGVSVGAGVAMEINGMDHGFPLQIIGFITIAVGIVRCPEVQ
jgi:hypothetical protein